MLGHSLQHSRSNFFNIVEGENVIRPTYASERAVGAGLTLNGPAESEKFLFFAMSEPLKDAGCPSGVQAVRVWFCCRIALRAQWLRSFDRGLGRRA